MTRAFLLLAVAVSLAGPAAAAPKIDPSIPSFVDLSRVLSEYRKTTAFAKFQLQFQAKSQLYNAEMALLTKIRYASDTERKEATGLLAKASRTPAEQTRLDELAKKSDAVDNDLGT